MQSKRGRRSAGYHVLRERVVPLDDLLSAHADVLGDDFVAYGNHAYRVTNFCLALAPGGPDDLEKIAVAAAFHDLGIWTHGTFDYLQPSSELALEHLARNGRSSWAPEIREMILEHHKITPYRRHPDWLAEPFRRADWIDVSKGLLRFGLPRELLATVAARWPNAGFDRRLVQLALARIRTRPWSPLPMMRL